MPQLPPPVMFIDLRPLRHIVNHWSHLDGSIWFVCYSHGVDAIIENVTMIVNYYRDSGTNTITDIGYEIDQMLMDCMESAYEQILSNKDIIPYNAFGITREWLENNFPDPAPFCELMKVLVNQLLFLLTPVINKGPVFINEYNLTVNTLSVHLGDIETYTDGYH